MKKLLSVILAVSFVMSLFCVVPASAESIVTWPYFFEDFEDNASSVQGSATVVEGGIDGSQYAGQFTATAATKKSVKFFAGSTSNLIKTGDTFKATADLKLGSAISGSSGTIYLHYTGAETANSPNAENFPTNGFLNIGSGRPSWSFDNTSTDWQKVSFEGVYTGLDVKIDGSMGITFEMPANDTEYTFMLDNVEIQIIKDTVVDSSPATRIIYENDFSANSNGITYTGTTAEGSGLKLLVPDDSAETGVGQVLQMTDTDTAGHVKFDLNLGETLDYNKYYLITYKARTVEAYDNSTGEAVAFGENPGSKHRWTLEGKYFWELSAMKNNNTWQDCALVLHMTNDEGGVCDDGIITMQWWIMYQGTGSDTGIYQFDDIVIREVGGIYNGNFDDVKTFTSDYYKEVNNSTVENGGTTSTLETEWTTLTNARLGSFNTSSLVTKPYSRTLYFDAIDGTASMARKAYLEAGQRYNFSAKIDPAGTDSCGTLKVSLNYTYTDGTEANSVDIVSIAPTARGYKEYSAEFTTPANMATAELVVTELGTGADVSRFETSKNLAYYTDDWSFEKLPSADIPVVTASATTAAGGIVTVAKTFTAPEGVTDASVIKLTATKDGVKSYIASTVGSVITVPESYRTGYELAAEITPIGSNGYIGKTVTIEVPAVPVIVETSFTANATDGATLTSPEAMSGKAIWAAYDGNGRLLDWADADISVSADAPTSTVPVPAEFDATGADSVKVMLWEDIVNCVPLANAVVY